MSSIAERTFNVEALTTAITALAPNQVQAIEHLYVLLDNSMKQGYLAGCHDATERSELERDDAWDNGYLDGVQDARANPGKADNIVQDIIFDSAEFAEDGKTYSQPYVRGEAKFNAHVEGADWDLDNKGYSEADVAEWAAYAQSTRD